MKIKIISKGKGNGIIIMKSKRSYSILFGVILILPGCIKTPSYNPKLLKSIALESDYTDIENKLFCK